MLQPIVMQSGGGRTTRRRTGIPKKRYTRLRKKYNRNRKYQKAFRDQIIGEIGPQGSDPSRAFWGPNFKEATDFQKIRRRGAGYVGPGDYKSVLKYASRGLGALAGGASGYMRGGLPAGATGLKSGWDRGASFSKFMGWGDYGATSGNQLITGTGSQQQISVNQENASGDIYIYHTEFVQNISASSAGAGTSTFNIVQFPLNPGLTQTFPFLSQLAQNYVLYEWEGLMFQYKPTSGELGNNQSNAIGKVIMATNYDPDAAPFFNSVQMENYDYANSSKPSCAMIHGVETKPGASSTNMLYVRTGQSIKDKVFTDLGNFFIATEGIPFSSAGSAVLGELWVTYKVRLSRASLYGSLINQNVSTDIIKGLTNVSQMVSTPALTTHSNIGCSLTNISSTACKLSFPVNIVLGTYYVVFQISQPASLATNWLSTSNNTNIVETCVYYTPFGTGSANGTKVMYTSLLTVSAPGNLIASIQYNFSGALQNNGTFEMIIMEANPVVLADY